MKRLNISSMFFVGAILAVLVPLAYATIPDSNGVIHACITKSTGAIRVIDSSITSCKSNETALTWNVQGPAGSPDTPDQVRDKVSKGGLCGDPNMAKVGPICVDKYEASVWDTPKGPKAPGGGKQFGATGETTNNYPCSANGNDCSKAGSSIFALSLPGVKPSAGITWFQAQQACANVGKRLLTNAEWQLAAAGTPDDYSCNISSGLVGIISVPTGSLPQCVSDWGIFDMVGNVAEWVADWWQPPVGNGDLFTGQRLPALYGTDSIYGANGAFTIGPPGTIGKFPAAIQRGGSSFGSEEDGVFMFIGVISPSYADWTRGFRCGK